MNFREAIKDKKRIVVKIGSSSLTHPETGGIDYTRLETLVRELCNIRNMGKDVILVSSGAISVGQRALHLKDAKHSIAAKQACAAVGQARLMMVYQKIFAEYNQVCAQILMTKDKFGDNDTLSAIVASLIGADLLILLSDIDGLFTDNPRTNPDAEFIDIVEKIDDKILEMGKSDTGSSIGTGGMNTKIHAAQIVTKSGADMIIANSDDIHILHRIMDGRDFGTLFVADKDENFELVDFVSKLSEE